MFAKPNNNIALPKHAHPANVIPAYRALVWSVEMIEQAEQLQVSPSRTKPTFHRIEWLVLGLIVIAALVIRVYKLDTFPDTVLADEADNVQDAVFILHDQPPQNGVFGFDWTPQPAFSIYKQAAFIAVFGFNIMALRLPSALFSALALIPFYFLLRRQFSVIPSLLATILLGTSVWYLNFSRSGWNNVDVCFYMLMAMLFLMLAIDAMKLEAGRRWVKWAYFALTGFFCGLGLHAYPSGRAITLAVIAFFPIVLLFNRKYWKTLIAGYFTLFVVEAILYAPSADYALKNWDWFNGRTNVVLILNSTEFKEDPVTTMLQQLDRNIRGPWDGNVNNNPQYTPLAEPQLDRVTGILALLGMALSLVLGRLRKRSETWLWWLMLLAGWTLTQLLTTGTPNGARGVGYMPTLVYFAGVGLDAIGRGLNFLITRGFANVKWMPTARQIASAALVVAIFTAGVANVVHYVEWQSNPMTRLARYLYITVEEFPQWSAAITELAENRLGKSNVGIWRHSHPIEDWANP